LFASVFDGSYLERERLWWQKIVEDYDKKCEEARAKGVEVCPRCYSTYVIKKEKTVRHYKCKRCNYKFKSGHIPGLNTPARVVGLLLNAIKDGLGPEMAAEHLHDDLLVLDSDKKLVKSAVYGIEEKVLADPRWLDGFIFGNLMEGVKVKVLEVDEIFQHRLRHKRQIQDMFYNKNKKDMDFLYVINAVALEPCFPLRPLAVYARDDLAFMQYAGEMACRVLQPEEIHSDDLPQWKTALKSFFPRSNHVVVTRSKKKGGFWVKDNISLTVHIERANRALRKTIKKGKKFGALRSLQNAADLNYFHRVFLDRSKGKTVVENLGLAWPKNVRTFTDLSKFARYVRALVTNSSMKPEEEIMAPESLLEKVSLIGGPIGKLVINVKILPPFNEMKFQEPVALVLNNSLPAPKRGKIFLEFLRGRIHEDLYQAPFTLVEVFQDAFSARLTMSLMNGTYTVVVRLFPQKEEGLLPCFVIFDNLLVVNGKINVYNFKLSRDEIMAKTWMDIVRELFLGEDPMQIKLLANCYFAQPLGDNIYE
jgi:ribosomal protein L37AE/L43A